jgi:hypothetical protein
MSKQFIQQTAAISTEKRDQNRIYIAMQHNNSNLWRKQCSTAAAQTRAMTNNEQAIYTAMQHNNSNLWRKKLKTGRYSDTLTHTTTGQHTQQQQSQLRRETRTEDHLPLELELQQWRLPLQPPPLELEPPPPLDAVATGAKKTPRCPR